MKHSKTLFLASASVLVLGLGAPSTAQAFDEVNWTWNKEVNSVENITINVDDEFDISGLVEIEKTQVNIGDVTANSLVVGITNNPPGSAQGTVTAPFDAEIDLTADYDDNAQNNPITGVVINSPGLVGSNGAGHVDNNGNQVNMTFDLTGEVEVDLSEVEFEGINDAVDLPSIESVATAVANNQSVDSTVAMNLHEGQYNMGDIGMDGDLPYIPVGTDVAGIEGTGNGMTDILAVASIGAALGIIQQGEVQANSGVMSILNASVDSSATAVGNNLSVDLQANTEGDAFLIADLTQFNYANVGANSVVAGVQINNYENLGVIDRPLVSSVATAVGNNVSISVSSPVVGE